MTAHASVFHNSTARSSGKSGKNSTLVLAAKMALRLGMVDTWPNLQTIRKAIESESRFSGISVVEACELILLCAFYVVRLPLYRVPFGWEMREVARANTVDRFWFEDSRWRMKPPYFEFQQAREAADDSVISGGV